MFFPVMFFFFIWFPPHFLIFLVQSIMCVYEMFLFLCIFLSPLSNPFCVLCQKPWVGALSRALDSCSLIKLDFHIYKENLLPLNWEYNFHNYITFCWNPFTDFDIFNNFSSVMGFNLKSFLTQSIRKLVQEKLLTLKIV